LSRLRSGNCDLKFTFKSLGCQISSVLKGKDFISQWLKPAIKFLKQRESQYGGNI